MADNVEGREGPDLSSYELVEAELRCDAPQDLMTLTGFLGEPGVATQSVSYVKRGGALLEGELTSAEAEAEFLRGGDARALCCEPDERLLVGGTLPPVVTQLPTPYGPKCC